MNDDEVWIIKWQNESVKNIFFATIDKTLLNEIEDNNKPFAFILKID